MQERNVTSHLITLNELAVGRKGLIREINGGIGFTRKLDIMGIHTGIEITKISKQWMKGPVTIRLGNSEIALGYGMAGKIKVEPV